MAGSKISLLDLPNELLDYICLLCENRPYNPNPSPSLSPFLSEEANSTRLNDLRHLSLVCRRMLNSGRRALYRHVSIKTSTRLKPFHVNFDSKLCDISLLNPLASGTIPFDNILEKYVKVLQVSFKLFDQQNTKKEISQVKALAKSIRACRRIEAFEFSLVASANLDYQPLRGCLFGFESLVTLGVDFNGKSTQDDVLEKGFGFCLGSKRVRLKALQLSNVANGLRLKFPNGSVWSGLTTVILNSYPLLMARSNLDSEFFQEWIDNTKEPLHLIVHTLFETPAIIPAMAALGASKRLVSFRLDHLGIGSTCLQTIGNYLDCLQHFTVSVNEPIAEELAHIPQTITHISLSIRLVGIIRIHPNLPPPDNNYKRYYYSPFFEISRWLSRAEHKEDGLGLPVLPYPNLRSLSVGLETLLRPQNVFGGLPDKQWWARELALSRECDLLCSRRGIVVNSHQNSFNRYITLLLETGNNLSKFGQGAHPLKKKKFDWVQGLWELGPAILVLLLVNYDWSWLLSFGVSGAIYIGIFLYFSKSFFFG